MVKKKKKNTHSQQIKELESNSLIRQKLTKIYELNKKDTQKKNDNLIKILASEELLFTAYENLRPNKGSMTKGTNEETADEFNLLKVHQLQKDLLNGDFEWTDIRRKMIPKPGKKKKRPLGIPNFIDKIVQEAIRIILNVIYEPVFQKHESNHGFRPKKGAQTAMLKLQRESKEMDYALEGDISGAYDFVNHKKLINILKKKINDKKFLRLIKQGLEHNINFEGKRQKNLIGTPQGGIASPILFNIYMNEFDEYITKYLPELAEKFNVGENRKKEGRLTTETRRLKSRIEKAQFRIKKRIHQPKNNKNKNATIKDAEVMRRNKKRILGIVSARKNSLLIRFGYCRYADDFIITGNTRREIIEELKIHVTNWFEFHLGLTIDPEKTLITDLHKEKAKFLGFTLFRKKKRIIKKKGKSGKIFRQKSTTDITIGVDHKRVKERLIAGKIMNENGMPRSNPIYMQLKNYHIVTKYKQRVEGLFNYYCIPITYQNELNLYHYIYKFSCLKTLARRKKKSIKQVTLIHGEKLTMEESYNKGVDKNGKYKKMKREVSFPTYAEITKSSKEFKEREMKKIYKRIAQKKEAYALSEIELNDLIAAKLRRMNTPTRLRYELNQIKKLRKNLKQN